MRMRIRFFKGRRGCRQLQIGNSLVTELLSRAAVTTKDATFQIVMNIANARKLTSDLVTLASSEGPIDTLKADTANAVSYWNSIRVPTLRVLSLYRGK